MVQSLYMKQLLLTFYISCLTISVASAQGQSIIQGTVFTGETPAIGVTVIQYDIKSNQLTGKAVTGSGGLFKMTLDTSQVYLLITHPGYVPYKLNKLSPLPLLIHLQQLPRQLNEVVIKTQKPFIEQQFDRMLVNVDGKPAAGINAADVLTKIPGVAVINNDILLEGKGITINIDGRPTRLSGKDLLTLLNSTSTTGISKIEVLFSPSAKYDAQGSGGIINIKTLKRSTPGYDGNISLTAGHGWKYFSDNGASTSLNYRSNNNYIFGSYSYSLDKQYQEIQTNMYFPSTHQRLLDSNIYNAPSHGQNMRLGWDHYINKKDIIGLLINGYSNYSKANMVTQTGLYRIDNSVRDSSRYSNNISPRTSKGVNLNVNYKAVIDSDRQQEITMDLDAGIFSYRNENSISMILKNNQSEALSPLQQRYQDGSTLSHIYSYKGDYTSKFYKGTLETGVKASYVKVDNEFVSESSIDNGTPKDNGSNDFIYKETLLAGYISSKQTFSKLTVQAGLRGEHTFTYGNLIDLNSVVKRSYFNLFPNLVIGYKLKNSSFSASYSRRIGRPPYNYLNPFLVTRSAYSVSQGNPYLVPSFTNSYRLSYNLMNKFSVSTGYSTVLNVITDLRSVDDLTKITINTKSNLSNNKNASFNLGYYDKLFELLNISYSGGISQSKFQFNYGQAAVQVKQLTSYVTLDNKVELKDWWIDLFFYGQTKATYGYQINLPFCMTNISGGRKILNGKGNLSLQANDVFFTGITRSEANYGNVNYDLKSKYDSRRFRLSFSYNFGNSKIAVRNRNSGSADEQRRTQ